MSTRDSLEGASLDEALRQIDAISSNVPIATTLRELQLVVERLSFSRLHERDPQNDPATLAEIDLFFRDEVSDGMVKFIRWTAGRHLLGALSDEQGRVFLDGCLSKYRKVKEVQVVTAIDLTDEHREAIIRRLRAVHPDPARILFSSSPSIIAGFVMNSGNSVVDKSLRSHVSETISKSGRIQGLAAGRGEEIG